MLKSSLLEVVRTFTKEDIAKFEDFLKSPYYNKNTNVLKLFGYIKKFAPGFDDEKLSKEEAWKKLYGNKAYNYGTIKNIIHELTKLAIEYIDCEFRNTEEILKELEVCKALNGRKIFKLSFSRLKAMEEKYSGINIKNNNLGFMDYFYLMHNIYNLKMLNVVRTDTNIDFRTERNKFAEYMLYHFLCSILLEFCSNRHLVLGKSDWEKPNITSLLEEALTPEFYLKASEFVKDKNKTMSKILEGFYHLYLCISVKNNAEAFYKFKSISSEIKPLLSPEQYSEMLKFRTFAITSFTESKIDVTREMFELQEEWVETGAFEEYKNGPVLDYKFVKFISYAATYKKFETMEKFIKKYLHRVAESSRESCYNYAMANIYYGKKEYCKSLECINKVKLIYFEMKYLVRTTTSINYYELGDYDSFLYLLDSGKHFLKTAEKTNENEMYKNAFDLFCRYLDRLFKLRENYDEADMAVLKKEISSTVPSKRTWLLEKADELKGLNLK